MVDTCALQTPEGRYIDIALLTAARGGSVEQVDRLLMLGGDVHCKSEVCVCVVSE